MHNVIFNIQLLCSSKQSTNAPTKAFDNLNAFNQNDYVSFVMDLGTFKVVLPFWLDICSWSVRSGSEAKDWGIFNCIEQLSSASRALKQSRFKGNWYHLKKHDLWRDSQAMLESVNKLCSCSDFWQINKLNSHNWFTEKQASEH